MNIILDIKGLVRQYIAPHRRTPDRLKWLWTIVDLGGLWNSFSAWREYYRYKVHVTSQHRSLQGHLTKTFGNGVVVKSFEDQFLDVGLDTETAHLVLMEPQPEIALEGEGGRGFSDADFIVYLPADADVQLVRAEIEKYKLADKTYKTVKK